MSYPDEELLGRRPLLRTAADTLPGPIGAPLHAFLDHLDATPLIDLAADYVTTLDAAEIMALHSFDLKGADLSGMS
jgi:nitrate reductase delta subunit